MSLAQLIDMLLTIYVWIVAAVVMLSLFLIARFYQKKAGQHSYFQYYTIPAILFLVAGGKFAFGGSSYIEDVVANCLLFLAGVGVGALGSFLLRLMMGGRR